MAKKILILLLITGIIILVSGCQNEKNIIALQKVKYNPDQAIINIYYFPQQSNADTYFKNKGINDYFVFLVPEKDSKTFFNNLNAEKKAENIKQLTYSADQKKSAIEKVVGFIEENNFIRLSGPTE